MVTQFLLLLWSLEHGHLECVKWQEFQNSVEVEGFPYGNWLRFGSQLIRRWPRREVVQETGSNTSVAPPVSPKRKEGDSASDLGENHKVVLEVSAASTEVLNPLNPAMIVESESAVKKAVLKETEAADMHDLMKVDKGTQKEESITQNVGLVCLTTSGEVSEVGLKGPLDEVEPMSFELQECPDGPRLCKPNVLEGYKWKRLSILDKPKSPLSVSPQRLFLA